VQLRNERDAARRDIVQLKAQIKKNQAEYDNAVTDLEHQRDNATDERNDLQSEHDAAVATYNQIRERYDELQDSVARRDGEDQVKKEEADSREAQQAENWRLFRIERTEIEEERNRLQGNLEGLQKNNRTVVDENTRLRQIVRDLETQASQPPTGEQRASLNPEIERLGVILHSVEDGIRNSDERIADQQSKIEQLNEEIRDKDEQIRQLRTRTGNPETINGVSGGQSTTSQLNPQDSQAQFKWNPSASQPATIDPSLLQNQAVQPNWNYMPDLSSVNPGLTQQPQSQTMSSSFTNRFIPVTDPSQQELVPLPRNQILGQNANYQATSQQFSGPAVGPISVQQFIDDFDFGDDQIMTDGAPSQSNGQALEVTNPSEGTDNLQQPMAAFIHLDPISQVFVLQGEIYEMNLQRIQNQANLNHLSAYQALYGYLTDQEAYETNNFVYGHIDPHQIARDEHLGMFDLSEQQNEQVEPLSDNLQQQFEQAGEEPEADQDKHELEHVGDHTEPTRHNQELLARIDELRRNAQQLEERVADLQTQLENAQEAVAGLQNRPTSEDYAELTKRLQIRGTELDNLRAQLERVPGETAVALSDREAAVRRELDEAMQQQTSEMVTLRAQLERVPEDTAVALNDRESAVRHELDQAMQQQTGLTATLQTQLEAAQRNTEVALNNRESAIRLELDRVMQQQVDEMACLRVQLQNAVEAAATTQNNQISAEHPQIVQLEQGYRRKIEALQSQLQQVKDTAATALETHKSNAQRKLDQRMKEKDAMITERNAAIERAQVDIGAANKHSRAMEKQLTSVREKLRAKENKTTAIQTQPAGISSSKATQTEDVEPSSPALAVSQTFGTFTALVLNFRLAATCTLVLAFLYLALAYFFGLPYSIINTPSITDFPLPRFRIDTAAFQAANEFTRASTASLRAVRLMTSGDRWFGLSTDQGSKLIWNLENWLEVDRGLFG